MDTWKSPSVFGKGLCIARSYIFRSYNDAVQSHYLTEILPVTSDNKSNTNAAAATLRSFLLVKVILALTDSENLELNFTEDICSNLTDEANKEYEEIVQTEVNNFQMLSQWISSGLLSRQGIKPVSIKYTNLKVIITVQLTCLFCLESAALFNFN